MNEERNEWYLFNGGSCTEEQFLAKSARIEVGNVVIDCPGPLGAKLMIDGKEISNWKGAVVRIGLESIEVDVTFLPEWKVSND